MPTIRKYSSRSQQTTLSSAVTSSGTSITVVSAASLLGGVTVAANEVFTIVIDPDTALEEIVDVVSISGNPVSGNTITIVRGRDGSTGTAHSAGAVVRHMAIGRDYREANDHINETTTAHGLTIANVLETTDTNMITTAMLQANAVTTAKITDLNVTTGKIADSAITSAKIADLGIATGDIADLAITTGKIAAEAVTTAKIPESAITNSRIAADAVTSDKIAADAVGTSEIADGAVTSAKIADGTIVNADINASAAIDKTKISGTAITAGDTGTVTSTMIADATIVNADVSATAAIAKTKLDLGGTITSADLVDGTIVNADINASAAIALSKLAVDPLDRANHTGSQTASTVSDFNTAVRTNRLDQMAAPTASVALNAQKITGLADPTNAQDAVTLNYITTQKGVANGLAELDGSGLVPTHHLPALAITTTQVVNSQANMLALTAQVGDVAVRTDVNKSFILTATPATTLGNWQELLSPTDAVLSVDGSTGAIDLSGTYLNKTTGRLFGNLDADGFKITDLGTPTSSTDAATKAYVDTVAGSATAAAASATAAAASYDSFDDRYLGSKSTAPSVDNDGNALITGALYWNSVSNAMFAWTGSAWGSISSTADIFRYRYTASGGETSESGPDDNGLTLSYIVGKEQVYLNGVLLVRTTDYTASNGSSITSLAALTAGDILEIITFTPFEVANVISPTVIDAKGDLIAGVSADTIGKLTVGSNGQYLQADSSTATGLTWSTVSGYSAPTIGSTSIASGATVTTIAGLTLTSPVINTATATGAILVAPEERTTISATAATGTINFDAVTQGVLYYTTNASANWTLNVRGDSGTTLNSILATGDAITVSFLVTNGGTAYYQTTFQVDGSAVTPKYSGGTAPAAGNASSIDVYTYTILKTANATFTVFGAGPIKYA
jgi:hypothetical protein